MPTKVDWMSLDSGAPLSAMHATARTQQKTESQNRLCA
jgi:hypothetical protein